MSGAEKGIYEPFTSPLDGERHIFVVGAKKAAKARVSEGENDESGEGGEGIVAPVGDRQLAKEKNERHPAVPGALASAQLQSHPPPLHLQPEHGYFLSHLSPLSSPLHNVRVSVSLTQTLPLPHSFSRSSQSSLVPPRSHTPSFQRQRLNPNTCQPSGKNGGRMHISSLCSFLSDNNGFQMAKRVPQTPDVDGASAAFKRVSLGAPTTQLRTHSAGASFRSGSAFSPGMAARRNKPLFKLSDITGEQEPGGGAAGAGPAVGVPDETERPPRRAVAVTSTPFANFGKIVYVLLVMVEVFSPHFFLPGIRLVRSTSAAKQSYTRRV